MGDETFLSCRRAQAELHPSNDWPVPGGDAGASAGPEERDDPNLSRHDGLGAAQKWQLQTGHPVPPSGHLLGMQLSDSRARDIYLTSFSLFVIGRSKTYRQAGQPHVRGKRR